MALGDAPLIDAVVLGVEPIRRRFASSSSGCTPPSPSFADLPGRNVSALPSRARRRNTSALLSSITSTVRAAFDERGTFNRRLRADKSSSSVRARSSFSPIGRLLWKIDSRSPAGSALPCSKLLPYSANVFTGGRLAAPRQAATQSSIARVPQVARASVDAELTANAESTSQTLDLLFAAMQACQLGREPQYAWRCENLSGMLSVALAP